MQPSTLHQISGLIADEVLQAAARSHSIDNLSVVFIAFKKFEDYVMKGINLQQQQTHPLNKPYEAHASSTGDLNLVENRSSLKNTLPPMTSSISLSMIGKD